MNETGNNTEIGSFDLSSVVDSGPRTIWVEFKGIRLRIRYLTREVLSEMGQQCAFLAYDAEKKQRTRKLDVVRLTEMLAEAIVVNWDGVTPHSLQQLFPIDMNRVPVQKREEPLAFNKKNLMVVLQNTNGLDEFLQNAATEASNFQSVPSEDLEKNSETTQSGS